MAVTSVKSHDAGAKHKKYVKSMVNTVSAANFFKPSTRIPATPLQSSEVSLFSTNPSTSIAYNSVSPLSFALSGNSFGPSSPRKLFGRVTLADYGMNNIMLKKEVLWGLTVSSAHLTNTRAEPQRLFQTSLPHMFDDSSIAQRFSVGKDKIGYIVNDVLYPHFREHAHGSLNRAESFAVSFDESLNNFFSKSSNGSACVFC